MGRGEERMDEKDCNELDEEGGSGFADIELAEKNSMVDSQSRRLQDLSATD